MIETIEDNETETQPEFLDWDESFDLFCAINSNLDFIIKRIEECTTAESSEFWTARLNRLTSAKQKLQRGALLRPFVIEKW